MSRDLVRHLIPGHALQRVDSTTWTSMGSETEINHHRGLVTSGRRRRRTRTVFPLKRPRGWVTRPIDARFSLKLRKITRIKGNLGRTYVFKRPTRVLGVALAQISSSWCTACGSLCNAPFISRRQHAVKPSGLYAIQPDLDQTGSLFVLTRVVLACDLLASHSVLTE